MKTLTAVSLAAVAAAAVAACSSGSSATSPPPSTPVVHRTVSARATVAARPARPSPKASAEPTASASASAELTTAAAPPPSAAPAPVATTQAAPVVVQSHAQGPASCSPLSSAGNCYGPGEFCSKADHGTSGTDGEGGPITCEDNDGWRWEAA